MPSAQSLLLSKENIKVVTVTHTHTHTLQVFVCEYPLSYTFKEI